VIPYRIETSIEEIESEINEKKEFFNGLQSDYDQFRDWEAKGMALRDTIDILDSMNTINKNEYLLQVIEKRK